MFKKEFAVTDQEKYEKAQQKAQLDSKIQLRIDLEQETLYKRETSGRHRMSSGKKKIIALAVFMVVLFVISLTLVPYGALSGLLNSLTDGLAGDINIGYSPSEYRDVTIYRVSQLVDYITKGESPVIQYVIFTFIAIMISGIAMSISGAVYQGVFQNPMASPTTLGVQSGGVMAGVLYIYFFMDSAASASGTSTAAYKLSDLLKIWEEQNLLERCGQQLFMLAGCFAGVALIVAISLAAGRGKINTVALMLAGGVFSTVINQVTQIMQYVITMQNSDDVRTTSINNLVGGRFVGETFTWYEVLFMAIPILICGVIMISLSGKLNILVFGEDEAKAMGMNVRGFRNILIACCTILTAVVLSFCGQMSMIGFMVPHFARYMVGPDFRYLVPASALLGGIVTLLVYDLCYLTGQTGSFNMYTGVICCIVSAVFILKYRRKRHADWA